MKNRRLAAFLAVLSGAALGATARPVGPATAEATRTLYFTALDARGAPVLDLTAADLSLVVGRTERAILSVRQAREPLDIAVIVNDGQTGVFAAMVADFAEQVVGYGTLSLYTLDKHPTKMVDPTSDLSAIRAALHQLGRRAPVVIPADVVDGINDAARALRQRHAVRPVIVVLTIGGESFDDRGTDTASAALAALNQVQRSHASLHVVMDRSRSVGPVLGEGPRQSGGTMAAIGEQSLRDLRRALLAQYALTYVSRDIKRADFGLVLRATREGVKIVAPETVAP